MLLFHLASNLNVLNGTPLTKSTLIIDFELKKGNGAVV